MDGMFSAWCFWKRNPDILLHPAIYSKNENKDPDFDQLVKKIGNSKPQVYVADFSYSKYKINKLKEISSYFCLLDHHDTAFSQLQDVSHCYFDLSQSGSMLSYKYNFPRQNDNEIPFIFQYVQDYDLWKFKLPYSKEINAGLQKYIHSNARRREGILKQFKKIDELVTLSQEELNKKFYNDGKNILEEKQRKVIEESLKSKSGFFKSETGMSYNVKIIETRFDPNTLGNYICTNDTDCDFALIFYKNDKENNFKCSLRSSKDHVHVGEIAKQLSLKAGNVGGGGGHPKASGFSCQNSPMGLFTLFN
jgi:oligoribonuclease NrnB/cAMP/cGMP phosphodiesterase (DHH superfamily)